MKQYDPEEYGPLEPLFPHGLIHAGLAATGCLLVLVGLAVFWPQPFLGPALAPPAPGEVPPAEGPHPALPWYLWAAGVVIRRLPEGWGLALLAVVLLALGTWPLWDRGRPGPLSRRPVLSKAVPLMLAAWALLSLWGALS